MALGFSPISTAPISSKGVPGLSAFVVGYALVEAIINTPLAQIMGDPTARFVIAAEIGVRRVTE
jgi:hypothetical protein